MPRVVGRDREAAGQTAGRVRDAAVEATASYTLAAGLSVEATSPPAPDAEASADEVDIGSVAEVISTCGTGSEAATNEALLQAAVGP